MSFIFLATFKIGLYMTKKLRPTGLHSVTSLNTVKQKVFKLLSSDILVEKSFWTLLVRLWRTVQFILVHSPTFVIHM